MTEIEEKVLEEMRELIRENERLRKKVGDLEEMLAKREMLIEWMEENR